MCECMSLYLLSFSIALSYDPMAEIPMCWSSFNQSHQRSEVKTAELCFDWVKLSRNQKFCCMVVQLYDDTKEQSWKVPLKSEMLFLINIFVLTLLYKLTLFSVHCLSKPLIAIVLTQSA